MIKLLARWFIKDRENIEDSTVRRAYGQLCGLVGIGLNVLLFAGKFFAGTLSGSIAITADAFNNLSDAGSSVVTLLGFRLAGRKPDPEHPFGHGRMEYISGLVVSALILLMGVELAKSSWTKIRQPEPVEFSMIAVAILLCSILVKVYMFVYNRSIGKKIHSAAMVATGIDSLSDTISTAAVLLAMLVGHWTNLMIDGWVGMLVALFILYSACRAAMETLNPLLGQPPEREFVEKIEQLVLSYEEVRGIHDMVVHDYGPGRVMVSLHVEVSANGNILEIHDMIDGIESELRAVLDCEAVIHMDPIVTDDALTNEMRQKIAELVVQVDEKITIHDFRMVVGPTHTNVIFDAVLPFGNKKSNYQIEQEICALVRQMKGNFFAVVQVENSYVN
ncbi:MAG: cation transporter [Ruminococcaceae bacterium]|nr:cation transporter [Oscillospiraceae bacterium]